MSRQIASSSSYTRLHENLVHLWKKLSARSGYQFVQTESGLWMTAPTPLSYFNMCWGDQRTCVTPLEVGLPVFADEATTMPKPSFLYITPYASDVLACQRQNLEIDLQALKSFETSLARFFQKTKSKTFFHKADMPEEQACCVQELASRFQASEAHVQALIDPLLEEGNFWVWREVNGSILGYAFTFCDAQGCVGLYMVGGQAELRPLCLLLLVRQCLQKGARRLIWPYTPQNEPWLYQQSSAQTAAHEKAHDTDLAEALSLWRDPLFQKAVTLSPPYSAVPQMFPAQKAREAS